MSKTRPSYRHRAAVRRLWLPILAALLAGSLTAVASAIGLAPVLVRLFVP